MIIKLNKYYELKIYVNRLEKRTGICSQKYNEPDKHILLWDFDDVDLQGIIVSLTQLQIKYNLPSILIAESSKGKYHAYCFVLRTLQQIINILSATHNIDMEYLRMGTARGYFTLRISTRKDNNKILPIRILFSKVPDETTLMDVTVNEYLTSNFGGEKHGEK